MLSRDIGGEGDQPCMIGNEFDKSFQKDASSSHQLSPLMDASKFFQDRPDNFFVEQYIPNSGPLLGAEEMEKYLGGGRKAIIQVTTWNSGSLPIPKEYQLRKLFFHEEDDSLKKVDVHVICIQECWPDADAWEFSLQTVLGTGFVLFDSLAYGTLHISLFMRRDLLWFTTEPSDTTVSVRNGRLFKTKGAAGISFGLFGSRFLFLCAHLSAGNEESRIRQRIEELRKILVMNEKDKSHGHCHYDATFICGDLNFRIQGMSREEIIECLRRNDLRPLLERDELNHLFYRKDILPKFVEDFHEAAAITFRPTYKYDIGNDVFDSSNKRRSPAYTDRILYKTKHFQCDYPDVVCLAYEAVTNLRVSDHKPVYAVFSVNIKPGFDTLPISGARFKREVFIKATQQRAKYLLEHRKKLASSVCSVA